ncbi:MAG TPA: hypothetical protein VK590_10290 [Saprospiraceae bacterium]|nr:hypothetical protein [Saprospiraceae bacterium]
MLKSFLISFCFLLSLFYACKNDKATQTATIETSKSLNNNSLPNLPPDLFNKMQNETTLLDMVPYKTKQSMSIDEQESIKSFVMNYIKNNTVTQSLSCTDPNGRLFFSNLQGSTYLEADLFFNDQCKYLIFYNTGDTKPKYAVQLEGQGVDYFGRVFSAKPIEKMHQLQLKK